jgi:hypothetical protein
VATVGIEPATSEAGQPPQEDRCDSARRSFTAALAATLALSPAPAIAEQNSPGARATVVRVSDDGRFDWADAGIGAAGGVALSMLGVGLVLLVSARSRPST